VSHSVETITTALHTIAVILYADHDEDGLEFFTKKNSALQLGYMKRPRGHVLKRHSHKPWKRTIKRTMEALVVRSGALDIKLYAPNKEYVGKRFLLAGDVILLCNGGHEITFRDDSEVVEVKQGPYVSADEDKEWF
jgi:hypothetical protein